jgi:hypothetical protein
MDASQLTNESRFNALFVGPSGCGKKAAACTFPHPIKYIDMDGRIRGLLGADWVERKGIDYKYYPPVKTAGQTLMYKELNDDLESLMIQASVNQLPYKTIILASLTGEFYGLLKDAVMLTHQEGGQGGKKGKYIGSLAIPDPGDYNFVYVAIRNVLAFFRSLPGVNIIVMGHTVAKFAKPIKPDGTIDTYADNIVVGSKLSLTDKASAEIPSGFDNIFEFSKRFDGNSEHFYVQFRSDIARTTYSKLPNGMHEITRKNFYEFIREKIGDTQTVAEAAVKS